MFEPTHLGPLPLENRLVMAPMTRNRAAADGVPTPLMAEYYRQRASAGLIIAEATTPNAVGRTYPHIPALYTDAHEAGWRELTAAVPTPMFLQLQHGGRIGHVDNSGRHPLAPSPIALPEPIATTHGERPAPVPLEMTGEDIAATVADFAAAARRAIAAGFSGVEVHAANGYLLHQFLADGTNRRRDGHGRDRTRFVHEVVDAVTAAVGAERVGLRISPGSTVNGIHESNTARLYPALLAGLPALAYVHVVHADLDDPVFADIRRRWQRPLIANPKGGVGDVARMAAVADLVALGRAFLANPDLVTRLRTGAPLNPLRPEYLMYTTTPTGYTDYPVLAPACVA